MLGVRAWLRSDQVSIAGAVLLSSAMAMVQEGVRSQMAQRILVTWTQTSHSLPLFSLCMYLPSKTTLKPLI